MALPKCHEIDVIRPSLLHAFLFFAHSKWYIFYCITDIVAHKLPTNAFFTMDSIEGIILFGDIPCVTYVSHFASDHFKYLW